MMKAVNQKKKANRDNHSILKYQKIKDNLNNLNNLIENNKNVWRIFTTFQTTLMEDHTYITRGKTRHHGETKHSGFEGLYYRINIHVTLSF